MYKKSAHKTYVIGWGELAIMMIGVLRDQRAMEMPRVIFLVQDHDISRPEQELGDAWIRCLVHL